MALYNLVQGRKGSLTYHYNIYISMVCAHINVLSILLWS